MKLLTRFFKNESGATAIEYGLIAALMAVVLIAIFGSGDDSFTDDLKGGFEKIGTEINGAQ